jgi:putative endonuclease
MNKREFGKAGEALAVNYLEQSGYRILHRNYWCRMGEVDIVAQKDDCVHFVEVKTRTGDFYGIPSESVTKHKVDKIRLAAECYMKSVAGMPGLGKSMQMDLIEVQLKYTENI